MHYLLLYDVVPDYVDRRAALADPVDGAVLLFSCDSPAPAEAFAAADPYVRNGLVTTWRVRAWKTVVGATAATPVTPLNTSRSP